MSSPTTKTRRLPAWAGSSIPPQAQPIAIKSPKEISHQLQSEDVTENSSGPNTADVPRSVERENKPPAKDFSKLMERVIFSISGLVNPERSELRNMALDMGAQFRPTWSLDSTLLVCPFAGTPTFKQVQASGGTVVHKDWIIKCYNQKELVAIEMYLLHVGRPWKTGNADDGSTDFSVATDFSSPKGSETEHPNPGVKGNRESQTNSPSKKLLRQHVDPRGAGKDYLKVNETSVVQGLASPVDVQQWVLEDLAATLTWLEQQDEKPEERELEAVAAQGLLVCLDDAVRSLKEDEGLSMVMDTWAFIPRAVKELAVYEKGGKAIKDQLVSEAERFKVIYESQLKKLGFGVPAIHNESRAVKTGKDEKESVADGLQSSLVEEADEVVDDDATEIISDTDSRDLADFDTDDTDELSENEVARCKEKILQTFRLD